MIQEIQKLIDEYWAWLRDKTILKQLDGWVEVTTPFIDRHNDYIQIYVKKDKEGIVLTDDSYTIQDLELSGCELKTEKRKRLLQVTLNGFGVELKNNSLRVDASREDFIMKKHNLIQAILAVNDLFYLASPTILSLFLEDVSEWLKNSDIRAISNIKLSGKSGIDYNFDFAIPSSRIAPERLLRVLNNPIKSIAQNVAFAWIDTRENRSPASKAYAILNDSVHKTSNLVLKALTIYEIKPILWSKREEAVKELAA